MLLEGWSRGVRDRRREGGDGNLDELGGNSGGLVKREWSRSRRIGLGRGVWL